MATIYRMHTTADTDALVNFWNKNSDWDQINRTEWEHRFLHSPMGPAAFALAIDKDSEDIIAQSAFFPSLTIVDGQEVKSYRPFGAVVSKDHRAASGFLVMQKLMVKMYLLAAKSFSGNSVGLLHMLPDPRWARIIGLFPFLQTSKFPLWSHALPLKNLKKLDEGFTITPVEPSDKRIDGLWLKASKQYNCMMVRDTRMLPWKTSHGSYQTMGVFKDNELVGLFAYIKKAKDHQWLITDLLTADTGESLRATLMACCNWLQGQLMDLPENEKTVLTKIALLATPVMEPVLKEIGFYRDDYDFVFVVHLLDKKLDKMQVEPAQWYVSAND
jgi:hypothetical protein